MTRKSSTDTLIAAMRILARDIQSGDGVANAAIAEAADRLEEQQAEIHAQKARIAEHLLDATKMVSDRQLADAVNDLTTVAIAYFGTEQLRERIATVVHRLVRGG